jgi:periplasmic copper chaperone A
MLRFSLTAAAVLLSTSAFAHASITPNTAANGASVKVAIAVPHGCDGKPTDRLTVVIPEGFVSAKPQVKAGWQIEVTEGDYAKPYELHGEPVTSGAVSITWSGGSIPDDQFDEFVLKGTVNADTPLAFATTQFCGDASVAWDQVAADGQDPHALEHPAPVLSVTADEAGHDMHAMHGPHDMGSMGMDAHAGAPVTLGDLEISGGFTRATLPNAPVGGGYITITNKGSADDRLVSAASPVAGLVQLHEMKMDGAVMKMGELPDGIPVPAGETVTLAPGGLHIMFMQLNQPFVEGTKVPVTLTFERAGTVGVELDVAGIGAAAAAKGN